MTQPSPDGQETNGVHSQVSVQRPLPPEESLTAERARPVSTFARVFRADLARRILRAVGAVALIFVFAAWLARLGLLPEIETTVRDAQMRLNRPRPSDVVLVRITDGDYDSLFKSRSPLNPQLVAALVNTVARGNPVVIGVDLDTSDQIFDGLANLIRAKPRIVWARDALAGSDGILESQPILGGNDREATSGMVIVPEDEDGLVRTYQRVYQIREGDRAVKQRSLPWAMVVESGHRTRDFPASDGPLEIRLAREDRQVRASHVEVTAGQLLSPDCSQASDCKAGMDDGALQSLFAGKIVLIGGTYRAARDEHATPVGMLNGMDVIAQVVDTEMYGGGLPRKSTGVMLAVLVFENVVLVVIGCFLKPERHFFNWLLVCFAASMLGALLCSWIIFGSYLGMIFFLPVFCAVLLLELYAEAQAVRSQLVERLFD